ncbi:DMT family transporter [Fulvivirga lutimaris]|uniref:DMT family transporter n=1 Tax=Fulvivirga lutimaris TaxID=1819566 RepID=UPI0012BCB1BB|nr:DMT family transporter [Fulvivirga lutimaris]MTI40889.1 EamA/RhaT family transporter [Fulvivirga lutimaris]
MPTNKRLQHLLELNFAVLFISTSGALGKYIDLPVPVTIGLRAVIAGIFIFLFCKWKGFSFEIHKGDVRTIFLSGLLMGLHWITYFYALKLSNVAIGMISLFTYPVITTFLEPLVLKTKFQVIHLLLGILVIIGILLIIPSFSLEHDYSKAIVLGVLSAIFYSFRNLMTKTKVIQYQGSVLMFYQLLVISIVLAPSYFLMDMSNISTHVSEIMLLALLTTAIGHTWFIYSFKNFSVTAASIISSLQPVYGIIIGMLFLKEYPEFTTIIGGLLILTSVVMESLITYYKRSE